MSLSLVSQHARMFLDIFLAKFPLTDGLEEDSEAASGSLTVFVTKSHEI